MDLVKEAHCGHCGILKKKKKMKAETIIQLIKLADSLDQKGFYKEAEWVDQVVALPETPAQMFIGEAIETTRAVIDKDIQTLKTIIEERFEKLPQEIKDEVLHLLGMSISESIDRWLNVWPKAVNEVV